MRPLCRSNEGLGALLSLSAGADEGRGGGPAQQAGDGALRVGLHLQRGPEAAGVPGQGHPAQKPHPHH